jgi:hypothetical protein
MKSLFLRVLAVLGTLLFAANTKAQTINFPIVVPLHFTQITGGDYKLGIYLSIGTGAAPALFELDTGATGFFATYSPNAGVSPWWGSDVTSLNTPVDASYASGLHYTGTLVEAAVTLFASSNPSSARLTTPVLKVGQMDSIVDEKTNNTVIWSTNGSPSGDPPVNGAFYGDLGMGLTYNSSGIINLLAQLNYRRGVAPGFRIHANPRTQTFLQIGLTRRDIADHSAIYLPMNPDTAAGNNTTSTGLKYLLSRSSPPPSTSPITRTIVPLRARGSECSLIPGRRPRCTTLKTAPSPSRRSTPSLSPGTTRTRTSAT